MEKNENLDAIFNIEAYFERPLRVFWFAFVLPFSFPFVSYLMMFIAGFLRKNLFSANDWLGIGIIIFSGGTLMLLSLISFFLCMVSIKRREKFFFLPAVWAMVNIYCIMLNIRILLS